MSKFQLPPKFDKNTDPQFREKEKRSSITVIDLKSFAKDVKFTFERSEAAKQADKVISTETFESANSAAGNFLAIELAKLSKSK